MSTSESTQDLISKYEVITGFNRFMYFALAAIVVNIIDSFLGPYKDYYAIYVLTITTVFIVTSLYLHKKGYVMAAKIIPAITFNVVFFLISLHIGLKGGTYLYYFPFIIAFVYLFRAEGNYRYVLFFCLFSLCFLVASLVVGHEDPPVFKVPATKIKQIFYLTFFISFSLSVYFFILIYTYQEKLYNRILDLEKNSKRQQLRSVLETQESSIQHIVYELRNDINQTLAASRFFLEEAKKGGDKQDLVSKSYALTENAMAALTMLCIKMHPAIITDIGFIDGTKEYIIELKKISAVQIHFEYNDPDIETINENDKISIFRIIQDYLTLVLKNPSTTEVTIEATYQFPLLLLSFKQNDPSFDSLKTGSALNLSNINNRITYFNGKIRQKKEEYFEYLLIELSLT